MDQTWSLVLGILAVVIFIVLPITFQMLFSTPIPKISLANARVIITGGSQGIGYEISKYCISKGASVVLIARTESKLKSAQAELSKLLLKPKYPSQSVSIIVGDVSNFEEMQEKIGNHLESELKWSHIDVLVCNAGIEHVGKFVDTSIKKHHQLMNVNYFGCVNAIYACYDYLKKDGNSSSRVIVNCSALGYFGMMCYSSYCASKFALRGLVESIRNEFAANNIYLGIVYPPDVETEQYKREKSMYNIPKEIRAISDDAGLFDATIVGKDIGIMIENGNFVKKWGLEGWMLYNLHSGMGTLTTFVDTFAQV